MSLEAAISELNTNIVALIAAMKNSAPAAPTVAPSSTVAPVKAQPVAAPKSRPAVIPDADAQVASQTPAPPAVTKETVKQAVLKLIKLKSNEDAVALLKKHGSPAGNLTTLPESAYAAVQAECLAVLS